jgi:cytochrome c oxidase assembly factor CtaG
MRAPGRGREPARLGCWLAGWLAGYLAVGSSGSSPAWHGLLSRHMRLLALLRALVPCPPSHLSWHLPAGSAPRNLLVVYCSTQPPWHLPPSPLHPVTPPFAHR